MQIDKLQIELRPRSHAQALDLGFALLRSHAGAAYMAFLVLWLPLVAVCMAVTLVFPNLGWTTGILAWWCRPLLERAPLYVLSRQVFGTTVSWQEAVRAWPRQLRGGALMLLTWGRPLAHGRGLMQPVWQLEMARGSVARMRRRVMSATGTGQAAFWFGTVCFMLEVVLQTGLIVFLGMFASDGEFFNPVTYLFGEDSESIAGAFEDLVYIGAYAIAVAVIAPIYTACCFTLYLNRRASLEAWDLEIQLRQIRRPVLGKARVPGAAALSLMLACALFGASLAGAPQAWAAEQPTAKSAPAAAVAPASVPQCDGPKLAQRKRGPAASAQQAKVRQQIDAVYAHKDLRGFECAQAWQPKPDKDKKKKPLFPDLPNLDFVAAIFKVLVIALGVALVAFVLYRYRGLLPAFGRTATPARATEVGGLDIRAESLPPDVTTQVRSLWARGERRAALALLYRATLSRLVTDNGLNLRQGDTEGDCLRAAGKAMRAAGLSQARLDVTFATTALWLNGAYGERWPTDASVQDTCAEWDRQFGLTREARA